MFFPRFNVTVRTNAQSLPQSDSFCLNDYTPPQGSLMTKPVAKTVRGKNFIFAVSDSVSTQGGTDSPSALMTELIAANYEKLCDQTPERLHIVTNDFLTEVNAELSSKASAGSLKNYGASYAMLHVINGKAFLSNLGNVSAFLFRRGELSLLTENHSKKEDPVAAGSGLHEENEFHVHSLKKYVGRGKCGDAVKAYFSECFDVLKDDVFLICSNGITDKLPDSRIKYILSLQTTDEKIVRRLISEALARGAEDDVTAMLVRNGGKPIRSKKKKSLFIVAAIAAALLAAAIAGISVRNNSPANKPAISEEAGVVTPSASPAPTEFMTIEE